MKVRLEFSERSGVLVYARNTANHGKALVARDRPLAGLSKDARRAAIREAVAETVEAGVAAGILLDEQRGERS